WGRGCTRWWPCSGSPTCSGPAVAAWRRRANPFPDPLHFLVCPREPGQSLRGSLLCCPAHRTFVHCMSLRTAVVVVGALLLALFGVLSLWLDRTTDLLELEARELAQAHESVGAAEDLKIRLLVHNRSSFL